jgi:TonB family protein
MTMLGGRFSAIGLSGAVHAAILLAPLRHGAVSGAMPKDPTVDVAVEPEQAPPEPLAPFENHTEALPTHTHAYPAPARHAWTPHDSLLVHPHEEMEPKVDTTSGEALHFAMVVSSGDPNATDVAMNAAAAGPSTANRDDDGLVTVPDMAVDTRAQLVRGATPNYPSAARAEGVEATVRLELVVSAGGSVEEARVVRSAGHGLDEAAMEAAHQFRFSPAIKRGQAVRVRMSWSVEFRLD